VKAPFLFLSFFSPPPRSPLYLTLQCGNLLLPSTISCSVCSARVFLVSCPPISLYVVSIVCVSSDICAVFPLYSCKCTEMYLFIYSISFSQPSPTFFLSLFPLFFTSLTAGVFSPYLELPFPVLRNSLAWRFVQLHLFDLSPFSLLVYPSPFSPCFSHLVWSDRKWLRSLFKLMPFVPPCSSLCGRPFWPFFFFYYLHRRVF